MPNKKDPAIPKKAKAANGTKVELDRHAAAELVVKENVSSTNGKSTGGNYCRAFEGATSGIAVASGPGGVLLWVAGMGMCYVAK